MVKKKSPQKELFETELLDFIDKNHPLCILANEIDWKSIEAKFLPTYNYFKGRPAKEVKLMIGLQYLKATYQESDESVVVKWVENPYWQYFCGEIYFQRKCPINPTMMTKFRNRVDRDKISDLLGELIKTGLKFKIITQKSLEQVNVDTTVQEKNITFPTDAKLYYKMLSKLVSASKKRCVILRQSYKRKSKCALIMQGRYSHARQMKRSNREIKKLRTYLGRVTRDISRKMDNKEDNELLDLLELSNKLLLQKRNDKDKIYSIHEPSVYCISKGKSHKKYEFGVKSSFATTTKECFIVGAFSLEKNLYDGHTLNRQINQVECLTSVKLKEVNVDLGYRGHDYTGEASVNIVGRQRNKDKKRNRITKRRSSIEPIIGHMKMDGHLGRNYLKGEKGDMFNTVLSACGQNIRKMLRFIKERTGDIIFTLESFVVFLTVEEKNRLFQG